MTAARDAHAGSRYNYPPYSDLKLRSRDIFQTMIRNFRPISVGFSSLAHTNNETGKKFHIPSFRFVFRRPSQLSAHVPHRRSEEQ